MRIGLLWGPALFLGPLFFLPLLLVFLAADASGFRYVAEPASMQRIAGAVWMAFLSVLATFAVALPLAWFLHGRTFRFGRAMWAIHVAPFVMPVFVVVYGMRLTLGAQGPLAAWGIDVLGWLGPLGAVVIAHAFYNYGFAARLLASALDRRPKKMEEAAAILGASPLQTWRRITLPLLAPPIAAVAILVFLFSLASFGVIIFMAPGQVSTLETMLYSSMVGFPRHPERAAALGIVQLFVNLILLGAWVLLQRRAQRLPAATHAPSQAGLFASLMAWAIAAIATVPVLRVLAGGFRWQGEWSWEPWRALLQSAHPGHLAGFHFWQVLTRTLGYAAATVTLSVALTLALAYGARKFRWQRVAEAVAALPLGASSLLIGFGLYLAWSGPFLDLRGNPALIVIAHTLVAFPFTARALLPAFRAHDIRLDEAASTLGASPSQVAMRIHWPLLRPAVTVAAGFAVAMSLGDYGASLLLKNSQTMTMAVWIGQFEGFDPLRRAQGVALTGLLGLLSITAFGLMVRAKEDAI